MKRRTLLKVSAAGLTGLALPAFTSAADARVEDLGEGLKVLRGLGGNILLHTAGEGQLLVDSGSADAAETLLALLDSEPGAQGRRLLINSHWHLDHCGGNASLGDGGARIIAHERSRLRLSTPYWIAGEDRYQAPLPEAAWPSESFYTTGSLAFDGGTVDYGYLPLAHSDGDIYVHLRDHDLLAVGGALSPEADPQFDWSSGAWIGGRLDALDRLLELAGEHTRILPADGPLVGRAELEAERQLLQTIYDRLVDMLRQGLTAADMLEAGALDGLPRRFEDPATFLYDAHKGLWAHHNKLAPNIV